MQPRTGERARRPRWFPAVAVLAVVWSVVLTGTVAVAPKASAQGSGGAAVDVDIEVGVGGVVPNVARVPVRVVLSSERSRTVVVTLSNGTGDLRRRVELNAGTATPVDFVVLIPVASIEVEVHDTSGARLGADDVRSEVDVNRALVGVGASIAGHRDPWEAETVAAIQAATLVPVTPEVLGRPGVLGALSGLVLAPADVDRLDDDLARDVSAWVARGGNLALDQQRVDRLPLLDIDAEPGDRTAVEAGWVRFTDGRAAAGAWSEVVEPAVAYSDTTGPAAQMAMFGDPMMGSQEIFDPMVENLGLVHVDYLPSWVIVAVVVFGSVMVGPVAWLLLRTRRRRGWMWLVAPGASVAMAAVLLAVGQGSLSDATTEALGNGVSTRWSTGGDFAVGTTADDPTLELGPTGQVWGSSPRIVADESGGGSVTQRVGANGFGAAGIGLVDVADGPLISVTAEPTTGTRVLVTVHNASDADLTGVFLSGFARTREFRDVAAGATERLEFETGDGLSAFGPAMPIDLMLNNGQMSQVCGPNFCMGMTTGGPLGRVTLLPLAQRGRVLVTGSLRGPLTVGGHRRVTTMLVSATAPVTAGADAGAPSGPVVRIETVGMPAAWPERMAGMPGIVEVGGSDDGAATSGAGDPSSAPTTTALAVGPSFDPGVLPPGPSFDALAGGLALPERTEHALMTSPVDQPALRCAVHTIVNAIDEWRDGSWVPVPVVSDPAANRHFVEPNETRLMQFAPLAAGETRFLRFHTGLTVSAPSTVACGVES